jgi:hypothetical protein
VSVIRGSTVPGVVNYNNPINFVILQYSATNFSLQEILRKATNKRKNMLMILKTGA